VPVPVAFSPAFGSAATTGATTPGVFSGVEFREFGVALGVRPLVGEDDVITLDVVPQVVNPDAKLTAALRVTTGVNPQTTAFETRSLRTSARLEDGQSLLIGGLNSRKSTDSATSTPWVRDVPVLGWLFKRFSVEDEDQELVIVVNPVIVRDPLPNAELWLFPDTGELLGHCIRRHDKSPAAADAASEHATNH
jgi:Flp pilus assembly secretin CpaC